jgi:YVTN family beta-propeller protein
MRFGVLGELVVWDDRGVPVDVPGPSRRALLAILLLHAGELLTGDRLIDELWGERAPATAAKSVQMHVWRLRKALGGGTGNGSLVTERGGYALRVEPGQLDLEVFERLLSKGRVALADGRPEAAAAVLAEALALWRGPPLVEFADQRFARDAIARLEELRLEAVEARIDADLMLGRHRALIAELESLVVANPLRERLRAQLMLALYRCGRQADALAVYRETRKLLDQELGLRPGVELARLEHAVLAHDPSLEPAATGDEPGSTTTGAVSEAPVKSSTGGGALVQPEAAVPAHDSVENASDRVTDRRPVALRERGRARAVLVAAGVVLLLAAVAAAAMELTGGNRVVVRVAPNSLAAIDPHGNSVVATVPVGTRPDTIAYGSGSLWIANVDDQTISRVDPGSLRTLGIVTLAGPPTGLAAGASAIWVVESDPSASRVSLNSIDPRFDDVRPTNQLANIVPGGPGTVATQGNTVWVAPSSGLLTHLNATTGKVVAQVDPNSGPTAIAVGDGAVWITDSEANNVTRVDPTGLLTPIAVGNGPAGIGVGEGGVWVADSLDNTVVRIDPNTRSVANTIAVGGSPAGIAVGAGSIWVADSGDGTVDRIDPRTRTVAARIVVGGSPRGITIADGRVWVTVDAPTIRPTDLASGGGTLRMDAPYDVDSMDPALAYYTLSQQLLFATCAKLLNYPDQRATAGSPVTPEVAQSLPERSRDGRTYTFKIRSGFRFSQSNDQVTAQTFKDTIERTLNPRMHSPAAQEFSDIVGADEYMTGKSPHISGVVARGDTLTIHLRSPQPDFPSRVAEPGMCAVPSDTPPDPKGIAVIPSAGPYYVASYTPGQSVVLLRNPNYRGSRPHRLERIQLTMGVTNIRAIDDIKAGIADYIPLGGPTATSIAPVASGLAARYGPGSKAATDGRQQYFEHPAPGLFFLSLNTHRPLFSDLRLRQAVNYAIDRRTLAQLGFPLPESPATHYLPPGIPGYTAAQVYPLTPNLAKARSLAQGRGRTATLYTCEELTCAQQAQVLKIDLAALGLHLTVKTFPIATLEAETAKRGARFDLAATGWNPDYPDPNAMLNELLEDPAVFPTFEDPAYQRRLADAARLTGPQRYLAYGKLDLDLARDGAPIVAIGYGLNHDFFSTRIGCQAYGFYGIDLAALCIKRRAS